MIRKGKKRNDQERKGSCNVGTAGKNDVQGCPRTSPNSNKIYLLLLNTDISSLYNQTTSFSGTYFESQLLFVHTFGLYLVEVDQSVSFQVSSWIKKKFF